MKHALVVGGTGMLSNLSVWLLKNGYHVSVIARDNRKMENLIKRAGKRNITPVLVDYRKDKELRYKLKEVIQTNGEIDFVVAWIHSNAENALEIIAEEVTKTVNQWDLFHVLGSSADLENLKKSVTIHGNCIYHTVQLGFILENNHSRWLTNNEISEGVIEAIKNDKSNHVVGAIEPWELRP
ncbi:short-chain dehydrogenase [Salinibacillus aidingensis]|uniref:Short-chain dehydrogenase n=1 Tax=Salinibacillus aidingensis TaxID=237684 RepID=A0ABP3LFP4_9BACI